MEGKFPFWADLRVAVSEVISHIVEARGAGVHLDRHRVATVFVRPRPKLVEEHEAIIQILDLFPGHIQRGSPPDAPQLIGILARGDDEFK